MLISLILGAPSHAFAPDETVYIGQEPVRLLRFHSERQHVLRHSEGWQNFIHGEGHGWQARFDEHAGSIHRAWGPGIEMGPLNTLVEAEESVRAFIERNPGLLLGAELGGLQVGSSGYDERSDTWYVEFDRFVREELVKVFKSGKRRYHERPGRVALDTLELVFGD